VRPTILLFDLDGTLVTTGGAGRRSMQEAFRVHTDHPDVFAEFDFGGMTDLGIVRAGLERVGRAFERELAAAILETYLSVLPDEVERAADYTVLPGVRDVLEAVRDRQHVAVGLGTGNIERGAHVKLSRGGLGSYFSFGGFGSDAEDRVELLTRGAERGATALGRALEACRVVIIGDTPRDVAAARAMGAFALAVATGGHEVERLRALGANEAVPDLAATGVIDVLLG
jgi:phosphoglycolate phosphatase-like HAD superfamily hydrolase